jgi:DnaK suppressor protein
MNHTTPEFDGAFIERQHRYLAELRTALLAAAQDEEAEEEDIKSQGVQSSREYEDEAQRLAMLELEENLVVRDLERLRRVDRALTKIEEGTYGVSDLSGEPIPRARLEAVPEAIFTLDEENALEKKR